MRVKTLRRRIKARKEAAIAEGRERRVQEMAEALAWSVKPIPELATWADCEAKARRMLGAA